MKRSALATIPLLLSFQFAFATIINVPGNQPTIQAGINATVDGDTVLVQPGTYIENINFNGHNIVLGSLFLTTDDTSYIRQTVIDGNNTGSVVTFENGEDESTELTGFKVTNGWTYECGGGINISSGASPKLANLEITNNQAQWHGGGIDCQGGTYVQAHDLWIHHNTANHQGGGIFSSSGLNISLNRVVIEWNTAEIGGGIDGACIYAGEVLVANNTATVHGGGLTYPGALLENLRFISNSSAIGGAVYFSGADAVAGTISNCIFHNNYAMQGGAVHANVEMAIDNCSFIYNFSENGEDLFIDESNVTVTSSIFWINHGGSTFDGNSENLVISCSNIQDGWPGDGNFSLDPLFCDTANNDYHLDANSPCLPGNHPDSYNCGTIGALGYGCGTLPPDPIFTEDFNHSGSMAVDWTIESHTPALSTPWTPLQDDSDDWSLITSQQQFQEPFDEWLISPIYDLSNYVDLELSFWHQYQHNASEARVRYSINGGASWNTLSTYEVTATGIEAYNISTWADVQANVRFMFVFTGEFLSNASWNIDDFQLSGVMAFDDAPPVTSAPIPPQPMEGQWGGLTGIVGCTFVDPSGVDASSLQVRIDSNGDGDYDDGGAEEWVDIVGFDDSNELAVTSVVTYLEGMENMAFEFRASDLSETNDLYGYSAFGAEGIEDDWSVNIFYEADSPVFSYPIPVGQPEPEWIDNRTVSVGCTVTDSCAVDAGSLQMRIDWNLSGDYDDPSEEWATLIGYSTGSEIVIYEEIEFPADGLFKVEFQASDTLGNGPGYSMFEEGITDDIVVRIDTTPPTASYLYLQGTGSNSATLLFSPTSDLTFVRYEVYYSLDSLVDVSDGLWTVTDDPALGEISTSTTTVTGLNYGTPYWFGMRAIDLLGYESDWSNTVHSLTEGTPLAAVTDLVIEVVEGGLQLTWSEPIQDESGNTPVFIEGYDIHASTDPHFTPTAETKIITVTANSFLHEIDLSGGLLSFYRVVALGCGSILPISFPEMTHVSGGTFVMGDNNSSGPEHTVTLSHDYQISSSEITNIEFIEALQWAFDNLLATVSFGNVQAHGHVLLNMNDDDCEIEFDGETFSIRESPGQHAQSAYPGGYDPALHPVKEVSWYGAATYCDWLGLISGRTPFYEGDWSVSEDHNPYEASGYRLLTEAEWERCARYSDNRDYPWGYDVPDCLYANIYQDGDYCIGWTAPIDAHPNGDNSLGVHDMAGNLWEWVNDWCDDYSPEPQTDPIGPSTGVWRVYRGGGFGTEWMYIHSAYRNYSAPSLTDDSIGFRICRTATP
jgi:formylglycine-generating enzyme required for sulfatase activity